MKKLFTSLLAVGIMSLSATAAPTFYAYQTWEQGAATPLRGPVKFTLETASSATLLADCSNMGVCYGGFYYNYKWYAQGIQKGSQSAVEGFYNIDMQTGERTLISSKSTKKMVDMTYDYTTNRVFGIQSGNEEFAEMNIETGAVTNISSFKRIEGMYYKYDVYMVAMAAALDGTLYGIATNDSLYTVDKDYAVCTSVGYTGVDIAYDQTMAFDYNTGTLYLVNNGDYNLYTVDTKTGKATYVSTVGVNGTGSISGLFVPYENVAAGVPDRVTNRKLTLVEGGVTLSWVNPAIDAQGNELTELKGIKIFRNGELVATADASAANIGKEMTFNDIVPNGSYSYRIVPFNSKGDGGVDSDDLETVIGPNAPGKVLDFVAVSGDGCAELSWKAPVDGLNGGEYDPTSVTKYEITRIGGSAEVVLEVTDPSALSYKDETSFGTYSYRIAAYNNIGKGAEVMSNSVIVKPGDWIVMGQDDVTIETGKTYTFYDNGGTESYGNNRNDTLTISAPENAYVVARFKEFYLDTYGDYLSVFNGPDAKTSPLYGKFTAESVPVGLVEVIANNTQGALTFVFQSDVMSRYAGWKAEVEAIEKRANDMLAVSVTSHKFPVVNEAQNYTVALKNYGSNAAKGYKVILRDGANNKLTEIDGVELASMAGADVTLSYTPTVVGQLAVTAYVEFDGDENIENNTTAEFVQDVLPAGSKFVEIANATTSKIYVLPVSFSANESITETIYPASRIDAANGLKLKYIEYPYATCESSYEDVAVTVWVGESEGQYYTNGAPFGSSNLTKVFDGTIDIAAGDEVMMIPFTTQYDYAGGNLVVLVHKHATNANGGGITFQGTFGSYDENEYCSHFASQYDDNVHFDPSATFGYGGSTQMANINMVLISSDSGVDNVTVNNDAVVNVVNGSILVDGNENAAVAVYSVDGRLVKLAKGNVTIDVPAGVYMVKVGSSVSKVVVK